MKEKWLCTLLALCAACSNDEKPAAPTPDGGDGTKPLYALMSFVFSQDASTTYVNLYDSLDITSVDFSKAREFPGTAGVGAANGKLFVSSGEAPTVMRFDVNHPNVWADEGTVSFASFGLQTAPLYANAFVDADRAYMAFNQIDRATWAPSTMLLTGTQPANPALVPLRDGLKVTSAYSRGIVVRDRRVFWPMYWSDEKYVRFSPVSQIAVYDADTAAQRALLDAPCPSLDFATQDEEGNVYFSNWVFSVVGPLYYPGDPTNCMVRIKRGEETIDSSFSLRFADVTGGREAAAFHYLANGKGFFAVFHKEGVDVAKETDPLAAGQGNHWRFWTLDLNTRAAAPIEGIDEFAGGYGAFTLDGRTFVLLPGADYAMTKAYEIMSDGAAVKRFEAQGWAYSLVKVR